MLRKLLLAFTVGIWVGGHAAGVGAAIDAQKENLQFHRLTQEKLRVQSAEVESQGFALDPFSSPSAPVEDVTKTPQEYCLWDIAVAGGCQPLPGSPLSAFPVVFSTDLLRH